MHNPYFLLSILISAVSLTLAGCGTPGEAGVSADFDALPDASVGEYKEQLRQIVREEIRGARERADETAADVYAYKPFYYKEFHDYPEGLEAFEIKFTEQESKLAPLAAEVKLRKLRFTTAVQRDRNAVRSDTDFQRELGTETISYELRNSRWRRVATLYVASELSTMMGGEWVPREEPVRSDYDMLDEEREGWFRRTWDRLKIGDGSSEQ